MAQSLTILSDIDFLPAHYRERGMQRRAYLWRMMVALLFLGFFTFTGLFQRNHHANVNTKLTDVESPYQAAAIQNAKFMEIKAKLSARRHSAELLTYLRHRWPQTQVMAAILEPLPDSITLSEWKIAHEAIHSPTPVAGPAAPVSSEAAVAPVDRAARHAADLKRLLQENENQQHFVLLAGHATDVAALHEYLARLGTHALFSKIDLRSIENVPADPKAGVADGTVHFTVQAILRPGHGQTTHDRPTLPAAGGEGPLAQRGGQQ